MLILEWLGDADDITNSILCFYLYIYCKSAECHAY